MSFHMTFDVYNSYAVLNLHDRFDLYAIQEFLKSVDAVLEAPDLMQIEINFRNVSFMDNSALGALLVLREKAALKHCEVVLCDYSGVTRFALETAKFPMLFQTRPAGIARAVKSKPSTRVEKAEEIAVAI